MRRRRSAKISNCFSSRSVSLLLIGAILLSLVVCVLLLHVGLSTCLSNKGLIWYLLTAPIEPENYFFG